MFAPCTRGAGSWSRNWKGLSHNEQERLRTLDLLGFQVRELEQASLQPGEDAHLEEERKILSNLEKIRAAASSAFAELYEDEGAAIARVAAAARQLEELRRYDSRHCAAKSSRWPPREPRWRILPLSCAIMWRSLEANPARLEEIEDRLALIDRLKRKYGSSVEAMLAYAAETRQNLASLEHADERREAVRKDLAKAAAEYRKAAEALSEKRRDAARRMVKLVREELAQLGMEKTRMEVHFESAPEGQGGATGIDEIEFRISPNVGRGTAGDGKNCLGRGNLAADAGLEDRGGAGASEPRRARRTAQRRDLYFR